MKLKCNCRLWFLPTKTDKIGYDGQFEKGIHEINSQNVVFLIAIKNVPGEMFNWQMTEILSVRLADRTIETWIDSVGLLSSYQS